MTTQNSLPSADNVTRVVLDNGLTVLVRENRSSPVVVLEGALPTGSMHDPIGKTGLSSMVAAILTRGSQHYDYTTFNETIESIGANLTISSEIEQMNVGVTCLSEDFPTLLQVLADVMRNPTFPEDQLELVRRRRIVRLHEREQDTASMANLRFHETIYGDHPYGRAVSGYLETIPLLQRSDLVDFHRQHFTPNGAILVVAGDVQTNQALELLQTHLGGWQGTVPDRTLSPLPPFTSFERVLVPMQDKFQSDVVLGWRALERNHPDYYKLRVANCILGVFGMMGRLGEVVREQQGLAYYSYSNADGARLAGLWQAAAGVNPANVEQAIGSILTEFERLIHEPVSAQELADSQAYLTGAMPLVLETNSGVASVLLDMEWLGLGLDYLHHYPTFINSVTIEDVQQVAHSLLDPEHYALVVAGPE